MPPENPEKKEISTFDKFKRGMAKFAFDQLRDPTANPKAKEYAQKMSFHLTFPENIQSEKPLRINLSWVREENMAEAEGMLRKFVPKRFVRVRAEGEIYARNRENGDFVSNNETLIVEDGMRLEFQDDSAEVESEIPENVTEMKNEMLLDSSPKEKKQAFQRAIIATLKFETEYADFTKFKGWYNRYEYNTEAQLNSLLDDSSIFHLSAKQFDDLCTEIRKTQAQKMFSAMPSEDFQKLYNHLKVKGEGYADKKIASYASKAKGSFVKNATFYKKYANEILFVAEETDVPLETLIRVIIIESKGDPFAYSGSAFGLMGLKRDVFSGNGKKLASQSEYTFEKITNPINPKESMLRGAEYLNAIRDEIQESDYFKKYKKEHNLNLQKMTMEAYNGGHSMMRWVLESAFTKGIHYFDVREKKVKYGKMRDIQLTKETKTYTEKANKKAWAHQEKHSVKRILNFLKRFDRIS